VTPTGKVVAWGRDSGAGGSAPSWCRDWRDRVAEMADVPPLIYTSGSAFPRDRRSVRRLVEALDGALKTDAVTRHGGVRRLSATPDRASDLLCSLSSVRVDM
jgi:hypothetical protein